MISYFKKILTNRDNKVFFKIIVTFFLGIVFLVLSKPNKKINKNNNKNILSDNAENIILNNYHYEEILERKLENLLTEVSGVGKIKVMITLANSKEIVIAQDVNTHEIYKNDDVREIRHETKKILLENKVPVILKEIEPIIQGVLIAAQGADDINIKNELIKSTQALLNVEAHKIRILKKN
jgi:stage III sporulation protein AG